MTAKILVIDDSPTVSSTVGWLLSHHGYNVRVARDALEALSVLASFEPDLIVLDIRMPNVDGIQLCQMFREDDRYASIPIVALSALSTALDIQRALDAGCNDYIVKPLQDDKLIAVIEDQLARVEASPRRKK